MFLTNSQQIVSLDITYKVIKIGFAALFFVISYYINTLVINP